MKNMENLKKLKEKEFAEKADRSRNTISLLRKHAFMVAALMLFHAQKDYNNYAGSQLVMANVINVEGADDKNINVTYRYNIAGKEYESDKMQYLEKIKKGDKKEIRVKKDNPEIILKHNDINLVIFYDVMIGLCLGLTVLCLYEMATCTLPSAVEEVKKLDNNEKKNDSVNLRSPSPSPRGLTNDDEVGVQRADGVSDSRVHVQLPSDRRANKLDRGFPSVDDKF